MKIVNVCSHSFFASPLSETSVVLDCGANRGEFSGWISQQTRATVHAFEPDPRLLAKQDVLPRVYFRQVAVGAAIGSMKLNLGNKSCSSLRYLEAEKQDTIEVQTIDLPAYCAKEGLVRIDLIKMDIEGAELDVLPALPAAFLENVVQITVEFHEFIEPADLPRIRQTIERLRKLGFYYIRFPVWTHGDVLFINERHLQLSWKDKISVLLFGKYLPGFRRVLAKTPGVKLLFHQAE